LQEIGEICRDLGVKELAVFGSILREDFRPDSDVDFLVLFENDDYGPWMSRLTQLAESLSRLLGRKVDVVPRNSLKSVLRDEVLASAEVIYAK
jgi:predicted nucleotidyltransferase